MPSHAAAIENALPARLQAGRQRTDRLFRQVPATLLYDRPIPERHRIAFYIGHLEAFDWNLLRGDDTRDDGLDALFAFGIDPVDGALPADRPHDWPPPAEIERYRRATRRKVDLRLAELMRTHARDADDPECSTRLHVAIEHRLMHAETLAYLLNRLPMPKAPRAVAPPARAVDGGMCAIPAGRATLGRDARRDAGFGWDNEFPSLEVDVPTFEIDRYMVSNGEFLRFVDAGGYGEPRWWRADDWQWRTRHGVEHPAAWHRRDGAWYVQSLLDLVPLPGDWPVYVSHAEAQAYARWAGKQLPTEAQWHRAAYGTPHGGERAYPWGEAAPTARHGRFDFAGWDPLPVDAHPAGDSAFGVGGLLGNGWEWTSTPFAPFPGFRALACYRGYSADFFDGRHYVLKGGSAHTAAPLLRRSFRNWFQPHYPYPFAGFRCVRS